MAKDQKKADVSAAAPAVAPDAAADTAAETAPKKKRGKKFLIISLALTLLAGAGGAGAWYFLRPKHDAKEAKKEAPKHPPVFVNLEPFTVNLQDDEEEHYLQTEIVFEVSGNDVVDPIKAQMPILRSNILLLLSSKSSHEIVSVEGKRKLAQEIIADARKHLPRAEPGKGIENLHFASFVIQ